MALGTIEAIPAKASFIFTTANGKKPFNSFSLAKIELDIRIADILKREGREPTKRWPRLSPISFP
jgi:hypothetical protein